MVIASVRLLALSCIWRKGRASCIGRQSASMCRRRCCVPPNSCCCYREVSCGLVQCLSRIIWLALFLKGFSALFVGNVYFAPVGNYSPELLLGFKT